jgi:hypothetical protein
MAVDPLSVLYTGLFLAVVCAVYGWLVAVAWLPFLAAGRLRRLFGSLSTRGWLANYALWMPLPGAVWGFVFGCTLSASRDVRAPSQVSPLYVAGVDGIVAATLVSLVLWPVVLLSVLPARGIDWDPEGDSPGTAALVVGGTVWYLLFLVGPAYALSVFAGFGDAMAAT